MALSPPRHSDQLRVEFPADHVILLTLNRPSALNAMSPQMTEDIERVINWFEKETSLWVAIVTGAGRIFCAGADLIAWNKTQSTASSPDRLLLQDKHGFGSLSRRQLTKPIIAAVNGGAYGGGTEIVLNCDIVVASEDAKFALPEVKRGVVAAQGGIPRLSLISGHQLASEMLFLGNTVTARDARDRFGFVNFICPPTELLQTSISVAKRITANSPDAVQSTKHGLQLAQLHNVVDAFTEHLKSRESQRVYSGENIKEGLRAFSEKRPTRWTNPAKL